MRCLKRRILDQNEDSPFVDLTSVIGMPMKLLRKYGILNGSILKICVYPHDLLSNITMEDAQNFLKHEKPKQKFVKVQRLTKRLDESDIVFISSILLFNLQSQDVYCSLIFKAELPSALQISKLRIRLFSNLHI